MVENKQIYRKILNKGIKQQKEKIKKREENKEMKKILKEKEKGITLIALVITIIVLLILAGVSIAMLTGDNGILIQANNAKENTKQAEENELRKLTQGEAATHLEEYEYEDPSGKILVIPAKCAVSQVEGENTLENGLVIIDINGNEWVWVEVPKSIYTNEEFNEGVEPSNENDFDKIENIMRSYTKEYSKGNINQNYDFFVDEWYAWDETGNVRITKETATEEQKKLSNGCGLTLEEYKGLKNNMLRSIYLNGGFWIGRYEAGLDGEIDEISPRTSNTQIYLNAVSKHGKYPYNFITCEDAEELASSMTPNDKKISSLLFGIQWDLTCKFIETAKFDEIAKLNEDSTDWGNYSNSTFDINLNNSKISKDDGSNWIEIQKGYKKTNTDKMLLCTGASNNNKILNIFDLAGNVQEYTLEFSTSDSPCVIRGGNYGGDGTTYPASTRNTRNTSKEFKYGNTSFRSCLY